jgi:hypothetical protein
MQIVFKYKKHNLEDMFFNASDFRWTWFTKDGISDTISFCPNQIDFLSPTSIKENKGSIYFYFYDEIPFGVFTENLDLNHFVHLNTMAVTIFDNKFIKNLE